MSNGTRALSRGRVVLSIAGALCVAFGCAAARTARDDSEVDRSPFVDRDTLDPAIPAPGSIIGHEVGADAVRYEALVRYLHALADASEHVVLSTHGKTHEGRTLYHLIITSTENHARLNEIREDGGKLADPRKLGGDAEARRIVDTLPGIAWLAFSIHGDEVSPCDSAMVVAYRLAAGTDETTRRLRDELVVIIDPLQNPDGRERYLAQIQTLRGQVSNPDIEAMHHAGLWSAGRGNHYLFDLNRDWLMLAHPETRGRVDAILSWNPHLLVDAHEMGALDTYLFEPPREPLNEQMAPHLMEWRKRISADHAEAFNDHGWSYYSREWYEEWYPGYTNAWGTLVGAIGILYEQAGVNGDAVTQAAGNVLTYREAVHHNVVSCFANIETLRANRRDILRQYLDDRRLALGDDGPMLGYFLFPPSEDRTRRERLLDVLHRHKIEFVEVSEPIQANDVVDVWGAAREQTRLPEGTVVVDSRQPHRRLIHAVLGFDPHMTDTFLKKERHELENRRGSLMYDISAWNLPMAFGVEAYFAASLHSDASGVRSDERNAPRPEQEIEPAPAFGYLVPFDDSAVYPLLTRLLGAGAKPRIAKKPFTIADRTYRRGTVLLRRNENPEALPEILLVAAHDLGIAVHAVDTARSTDGPDLGGREFALLHEPRVAIASQWPCSTGSFGSAWFLLDHRVGMRSSPVNIQNLGRVDLRKYNVLIIPSASRLTSVLGPAGPARLRTWLEAGGTLITIGGSTAALANEKAGLSSVRRHRDVLDELDVYAEAVDRELAARDVSIDPDAVWDREAAPAEDDAAATAEGEDEPSPENEDKKKKGDLDALKRADAWARTFSPSGAIVTGRLDPEHWLCYGLGDRLPLLVSGSTVLRSKPPAHTPVRFGELEYLRLGGLLWPEARPRLAGSAYVTVERVGNGQVILFAQEPFYRGYWEGTGRLLLNAAILGPGMGTRQPLPW